MRRLVTRYAIVLGVTLLGASSLLSCGGGGGDGGGSGGEQATTFTGNLAEEAALLGPEGSPSTRSRFALLSLLVATAHAQEAVVEVCVEGTDFCTFVDENGFFTLAADVGGDVTLVFSAPDFTARVALTGVPRGATVRLRNIRCSTVTGTCEPEDVEIEGGAVVRGPIRCQRGPILIVQNGNFEVVGDGQDCIRTEGQCDLTIEAKSVLLRGCERCVRSEGGSQVVIAASGGNIECNADEDGVRSQGNSTVNLAAAGNGDVVILAGDHGIRAEGKSVVELEATGRCVIGGDEAALRVEGAAEVDTAACSQLDLRGGGVERDDDEDDDEDEDGDDGEAGRHHKGPG